MQEQVSGLLLAVVLSSLRVSARCKGGGG